MMVYGILQTKTGAFIYLSWSTAHKNGFNACKQWDVKMNDSALVYFWKCRLRYLLPCPKSTSKVSNALVTCSLSKIKTWTVGQISLKYPNNLKQLGVYCLGAGLTMSTKQFLRRLHTMDIMCSFLTQKVKGHAVMSWFWNNFLFMSYFIELSYLTSRYNHLSITCWA